MIADQPNRVFRPSIAARIGGIAVCVAATALWATHGPERFRTAAAIAIGVLGLFWIADLLTTRIALAEDRLDFVFHFRRRAIPRSEISDVTWDRPAGVRIKFTDGRWIRLPTTGHSFQGQANTIRAWLKTSPKIEGTSE